MDGISISIDVSTIGILMFILYKIVQLDLRLKRIEKKIFDDDN